MPVKNKFDSFYDVMKMEQELQAKHQKTILGEDGHGAFQEKIPLENITKIHV